MTTRDFFPVTVDTLLFKKIIIAFWALWWGVALWTDIVGALAHLGYLNATWAPDQNYPFLVTSLSMYSLPSWVPPALYAGIIAWSALASGVFVWAVFAFRAGEQQWMRRAEIAFIVSLCLWLSFFLADQLVMKFNEEENHMVQGGFQFLCFLSLYLLPSKSTR